MRTILLLSVFLLLFFNPANAQVKTNFNNTEHITARGKFVKDFRGKSPHIIPARDIKACLRKKHWKMPVAKPNLLRLPRR